MRPGIDSYGTDRAQQRLMTADVPSVFPSIGFITCLLGGSGMICGSRMEPYDLHDLADVFLVGSVRNRSCATSHGGR